MSATYPRGTPEEFQKGSIPGVRAGEDLSDYQGYAVYIHTDELVYLFDASGDADEFFILTNAPREGEGCDLSCFGRVDGICDGGDTAIATGDFVIPDSADGKLVKAVAGETAFTAHLMALDASDGDSQRTPLVWREKFFEAEQV